MNLTFIRHAQSVSNAGGLTMPHAEIPLSALGHAQAAALAAQLSAPVSTVWASRFFRTQQTAEHYCKRFRVRPQIHPELHEFSVIDAGLIAGLDGAQRKPFVKAYWDEPDPHRRLGPQAETFAEFDARVSSFRQSMDRLPDGSMLFAHGIWLALLFWKLQGNRVTDELGMRNFREFQLRLPMPNCAVFNLNGTVENDWRVEPVYG